jgi:hypothetical protein
MEDMPIKTLKVLLCSSPDPPSGQGDNQITPKPGYLSIGSITPVVMKHATLTNTDRDLSHLFSSSDRTVS